MIVGARRRRAEVGVRVRLQVILYRVDADADRWGFTITDRHHLPLVRSAVKPQGDERTFTGVAAVLHELFDLRLSHAGTRIVRDDEQWHIAVRSLHGASDEIAFRVGS